MNKKMIYIIRYFNYYYYKYLNDLMMINLNDDNKY